MKKIFLQVSNAHWTNNAFFKDEENLLAEPWRELKRQLFDLGYELTTPNDLPLDDCEWIIFIDSSSIETRNYGTGAKWRLKKLLGIKTPKPWPYRNLYREGLDRGMHDRMVFFAWEPSVVDPHNYDPKLWAKFKHVFTWDAGLAKRQNFLLYLTPLSGIAPLTNVPCFSQKKLLVNLSTNKFSSRPNEFYSARRKTIDYFTKHYPDDFDLYGTRWNTPQTRCQRMFPWLLVKKYKNYRGSVPRPMKDKIKVLSGYKFSLCYENMVDDSEHFTEKIFDALCARTVPIYWGAEHLSKFVDEDVFIDRRKFKNDQEVAEYITTMSEKRYNAYLAAAARYHKSKKYAQLLPHAFAKNIIDKLGITKAENE